MKKLSFVVLALCFHQFATARVKQPVAPFPEDPLQVSASCTESDFEGINAVSATAVRVVDGDTVKVDLKGNIYNIRMLSIDTPETHFQGKSQGYWGEQAALSLASQVKPGDQLVLELEGTRCDRFGRILAYVWKGNLNLNEYQIATAFAFNYCIFPNARYCARFASHSKVNSAAKRGIYSDNSLQVAYEWRRQVSGQPMDKYVGNIVTHEVLYPKEFKKVAVWARVFFMKLEDIVAPYRLLRFTSQEQ